MTPGIRKSVLIGHIIFSVGWLVAVAAFLVLAISGLTSQDAQTTRAVYPAMELIARLVIVPLAFAALLSGLIQSLGTPWGLFRHYWIVSKLLLTVFATIVLLKKMPLISDAAHQASQIRVPSVGLRAEGTGLTVHAAGGLLVLLVITILSVFKPFGLTGYGRRKQQERRHQDSRSTQTVGVKAMPDLYNQTSGDGRPSRLKIWVAAGIAVVVLVVHISIHLTGLSLHHGH